MTSSSLDTNVFDLASRLEPALADAGIQRATENEVLFRLTRELQSSLEIDQILLNFLRELKTLISVDALSYYHAETDSHFSSGQTGVHKVSYQLNAQQDLGSISFTRSKRFKEDDLILLEKLVSCLFFPLRNAIKYRSILLTAETDALTGSGNRRALESALEREINIAQRDEIPLSLLIFDFDYFKAINDKHGHACGDLVLKQALWQVRQHIRKTDLVFRYGGEEFVILLHKTELACALNVAEKIRACIEQEEIVFDTSQVPISASFGVTALSAQDNPTTLIERADRALYRAKGSGRNKVCCDI